MRLGMMQGRRGRQVGVVGLGVDWWRSWRVVVVIDRQTGQVIGR